MADYIRHNEDRVLNAVTDDELKGLANQSQPLWKDICLISVSVGIPTLINAIAETASQEKFSLSITLFLNYLFGIIGVLFFVIFGIAWRKSHKSTKSLIEKIQERPQIPLSAGTSDVGALEDLDKRVGELESNPPPAVWG